jgi:hypothetical protein
MESIRFPFFRSYISTIESSANVGDKKFFLSPCATENRLIIPTIEELAQHLRTSKSALYERLHRIAEVLKQRYHTDDSPDGVASPDDLRDPLTGKLVVKPKSKENLNWHDGDSDRD